MAYLFVICFVILLETITQSTAQQQQIALNESLLITDVYVHINCRWGGGTLYVSSNMKIIHELISPKCMHLEVLGSYPLLSDQNMRDAPWSE